MHELIGKFISYRQPIPEGEMRIVGKVLNIEKGFIRLEHIPNPKSGIKSKSNFLLTLSMLARNPFNVEIYDTFEAFREHEDWEHSQFSVDDDDDDFDDDEESSEGCHSVH